MNHKTLILVVTFILGVALAQAALQRLSQDFNKLTDVRSAITE